MNQAQLDGDLVELTKLGEAADEGKVGKQRDKDKLRLAQEEADTKAIMAMPAGRRFVANIIKDCGVGHIAYRDTDRATAFALGHQNYGHALVAKLRRHCLDLMRLMEDEDSNDSGS